MLVLALVRKHPVVDGRAVLRRLKSAARRWQELAFVLASKREHSRKPHTDYRSPIDELSSTNSEYEYEHEYEDYERLLFRWSGSSMRKAQGASRKTSCVRNSPQAEDCPLPGGPEVVRRIS